MPVDIKKTIDCTGCAACANVCPKQCITMEADAYGFDYPIVDITKCIYCDKCEVVCPLNSQQKFNIPTNVYAAWNKNENVRNNSTSGGVFSELAFSVLKQGGVVVGAVYNDENVIEHCIIDEIDQLEKVRQSKYAQSKINDIYLNIRSSLKYQSVLFCGTPCQVAGLKRFLGKEYENLMTVDFICRGVNSPKALKAWISEIEYLHKSKVRRVWFKYKEDGWHRSPKCTKVILENGNELVFKGRENSFMYGYLGPNLYIRPSCSECLFKGQNRLSDITLGDFWGIEDRLDDDKGTSLVLVNSDKGKELLSRVSGSLFLEERNLDEILDGNVCFEGSVKIHTKSEEFLRRLDDKNFSSLVYDYSKKKLHQKIFDVLTRLRRIR